MKTSPLPWELKIADISAVLARWVLGATFVYTGVSKAVHPVEFLKLLRQYNLTHDFLILNFIAAALPWFEIFCGLLLLAGIAVRGTALVLTVMLIPFTLLVLHRALAIQSALAIIPFCLIKFDCGCGTGDVFVCRKLLQNAILILLSGWILVARSRRFSLRFSLIKS